MTHYILESMTHTTHIFIHIHNTHTYINTHAYVHTYKICNFVNAVSSILLIIHLAYIISNAKAIFTFETSISVLKILHSSN